jgi:hypothetical protein
MAEEIEVVQSAELPWGGRFVGHEGVKRFFELLGTHLEGTGLPMERFLEAGDHVVAIGRTQGKVRKNGKTFDVPLAHVWEIRDGMAVGFRPFIDHVTMREALEGKN